MVHGRVHSSLLGEPEHILAGTLHLFGGQTLERVDLVQQVVAERLELLPQCVGLLAESRNVQLPELLLEMAMCRADGADFGAQYEVHDQPRDGGRKSE